MRQRRSLWDLNQLIVFELSRCLSLKTKIKLSGVCKKLHRKIHYKNASGKYICLKTDGIEKILIKNIESDIDIVRQNKMHVIPILAKSVVDINFEIKGSYTALTLASRYNKIKIVKLLLENGANIGQNDIELYKYNALIIASKYGNFDIVKLFLEQNEVFRAKNKKSVVDIDYQTKSGYTALHWACMNGHTSVAKLLLEHGAKPNLKNQMGKTAMSIVQYQSHKYSEIIKLLGNYKN